LPDVRHFAAAWSERAFLWLRPWFDRAWEQVFLPYVPALMAATLLIVAAGIAAIIVRWRRDRMFHSLRAESLDVMSGPEFERFLAGLFAHLGYRVQEVGGSHDFGADLLLSYRRRRTVVQAKRYSVPVGIGAVQEVLGGIQHYHADRGIVVATTEFTHSARILALEASVELWNRQQLLEAMARAQRTRGGNCGRSV
jgi:HJR/Mrr/RecB family endonuclease